MFWTVVRRCNLCFALLFYVASCGAVPLPAMAQSEMLKAHASTMEVRVFCGGKITGRGTGFAISPTAMITADHVVRCSDGTLSKRVIAIPTEGYSYELRVESSRSKADVARLRMTGTLERPLPRDFKHWRPVVIAPPSMGQELYVSTAVPFRNWARGSVVSISFERDYWTHISYITRFGNSGSPVFDSHGRLIGVLVRLNPCPNFPVLAFPQVCGGIITTNLELVKP